MGAMAQREYLIEMDVRVDGAGTIRTLCYSVYGFNSEPFDASPNVHYAPRLLRPGVLSQSLYMPGSTGGSSRSGFGGVQLSNVDGGLDALIDYGFAGNEIRILVALRGARYADFKRLCTGVMEQPVFDWNSISISVRDKQSELSSRKLQANLYLGTNSGSPMSGAEGTANDIKGSRKPLVFGQVSNVRAVRVNTDRNIYQVHDGLLSSISAVYVAGVALTAGAVYPDYATMESTAPAAGQFRALPALGLFRIDAATSGQVTADATQGTTSADRTVAQMMRSIALRAGLTAAEISSADVTALDALCPQALGAYFDGMPLSGAEAMDMLARSVGAWWTFDPAGVLRMGRLALPSGDPVRELDTSNVMSIARLRARDEGAGVPAWRINVKHSRNWTVQTTGLASAVTAARAAYLSGDGLVASANDATVQAQYPLAVERSFDTLMVNAGDAATEAARLLTLYKSRRDMLVVRARLDLATADVVRPGAVVRLTWPRYGMNSGKLFTVLGVNSDYQTDSVEYTLWG